MRVRYTITAAGRRALASWVVRPGHRPVLEFEQLIKINYGDVGTREGILANLEATLAWVREQNAGNLEAARLSRMGHGLAKRAALNHLTGRFLTDYYLTVARWARWAIQLVDNWPQDVGAAVINEIADTFPES
jgi:PadR family transcriptional regulator AphA